MRMSAGAGAGCSCGGGSVKGTNAGATVRSPDGGRVPLTCWNPRPLRHWRTRLALTPNARATPAVEAPGALRKSRWDGQTLTAYLRHVLDRIAEHPINRIDELLPWAVADQINTAIAEQRLAA
jgi:hypothetical protein